jgi:SAM-dependent methyltransferase
MIFANHEQAGHWAAVAPIWLEIEDDLELVSGLPGDLAMDRLDLQPGQQVLDLGCGTGRTTLALASRVAPGGQVLGVDIAADMLVRARQHAAGAGVDNATFVQGDVQAHDLGAGRFDAAYSRFGVMFFADPVAAFASVNRALRRGGRLSFVCWQPMTGNEWMLVPGMAAASVVGTPPSRPDADQPGAFSLSDPRRTRNILRSAGFRDIDIAPHRDFVVTLEDRIPHAAETATRVGGVRDLLDGADPSLRHQVRAAIEAALRARLEDGEVRLSRSVYLVTART